jgi:hypothetical protein
MSQYEYVGSVLKKRPTLGSPVSSIGNALDYESVQVTFVVIDHEIFSTVIRTVPLLWHLQNFCSLRKWKQLILADCLPACPGTIRWLNSALVNLM